MTERVPALIASPGIRKVRHLERFLPEYDLGRSPRGELAVLGWGRKWTGALGRSYARVAGIPYVSLEDGFLRSVGLGERGAASISLIVDDLGIYYDATGPSRLETLIASAPQWCDDAMTARARALIDRLVATGLSKTNLGAPLNPTVLQDRPRILIVDQTRGDASIRDGLATPETFARMIAGVRAAHADAQLIVKRHPAVAAGRKRGCIAGADLAGVTLLDTDVSPASLLVQVDAVHVVTSGLGFEALLRGLPVTCWGAPFYSGWGLTTDHMAVERRGVPRSVEQVAAAALIAYSRYVDPVTGQACEVEQAIARLEALRARARRLEGPWEACGFAPAKRAPVRRLLNAPTARLTQHAPAQAAARAAEANGGRMIWWAGKESEATLAAAAATSAPTVRMEDGFIRSRGLGSDFHGALSVVLDDLGIYYDATRPSRLEALIQGGAPTSAQLARAEALRARIVEAGLSKYNLKGAAPPTWPSDRPRLLVVGQVENDRSILLGCTDIRTNSGLVEAARRDFPGAFLIYRNHPDVTAGNRPGLLAAGALSAVDAVADDLDIIDCLNACDRLVTLTSLTGFEARMRGKPVTTYGRPFYAGWGLTDDRGGPFERRTARPGLAALIHATLIDYPLYVTPEGWPCEAEDLVEALIALRDVPLPEQDRGGLARWRRGLKASLDREAPPAY